MTEYGYGVNREKEVATYLRKRGWSVKRSPGSRGPYDLEAIKGNRTWLIQVKATRKYFTSIDRLLPAQRSKLVGASNLKKGTPVLALVTKKKMYLLSARNWHGLDPY